MRRSVKQLNEKMGCGYLLGEDGFEAYFDLILAARSRQPRAFDWEGCGILGTLWTRTAASCKRQGHTQPSGQIRKSEFTLSPCADCLCRAARPVYSSPLSPIGGAAAVEFHA